VYITYLNGGVEISSANTEIVFVGEERPVIGDVGNIKMICTTDKVVDEINT